MKIIKILLPRITFLLAVFTLISCKSNDGTFFSIQVPIFLDNNEIITTDLDTTLHEHFTDYIYKSASTMLDEEIETTTNLWWKYISYPYYNVEIINPISFHIDSAKKVDQIMNLTESNTIKVILCDLKFDSLLTYKFIILKDDSGILGCFSNDLGQEQTIDNHDLYKYSLTYQMTDKGISKTNYSSNKYIEVILASNEPVEVNFYKDINSIPIIENEIIPNTFKSKEIRESFALITSGGYDYVTFDVCVQENQYETLIVKSDDEFNLRYMYFDKNKVIITKDGVKVSVYDIKTGTKLRVSYNLREASYNPDKLFFNKFIMLNEEIEVNEVLVKVKEIGHTIKIEKLDDYNIDYFRYDDNTKVYKNGVLASITDIKVGSIIKVNIPICCDEYPKNIFIDNVEIINN